MNDKIYFSLGPVQGFVAQARRTRDLWSGSFLLSYLAGCAINEVLTKGGKITVPDVNEDELLAWIGGSRKGDAPMIGSLPNRFEAIASNPKDVADSAAKVVQQKWEQIAQAVWDEFLTGVAENGRNTKVIWDRQIKGFWEISWVIGPNISLMNSRKNWRTCRPSEEGGDHCTMMGDWQELSGFIRSHERIKQNGFWNRVQSRVGKLDLRENERLCAMALIKRLFPKVSGDAIGWKIEAENWPSTPYIAAVPWLNQVMGIAASDANNYASDVLKTAQGAKRKGISGKIGLLSDRKAEPFLNLDGNFYFESALADSGRTPLDGTPLALDINGEEPAEVKKKREELLRLLNRLGDKVGSRPFSFYAMLLMDGDNMGKLIGEKGGEPISKALSIFTGAVRNTVQKHNGVTIYAGGDDVLAMLPMPDAIGCALALSKKYVDSFKESIPEVDATISAGLVFSHYHIPLRSVMEEAHHILDDVAKDQNGRASIAVSVLKPSGKYCQWTATWDRLIGENGTMPVDDLVSRVQAGDKKQFSTSFFYSLRDDLSILSEDPLWKPGSYGELVEGLDPVRLLTAEYMKSRERTVTREEAEERVKALLELSYKSHRATGPKSNILNADAAMLIKFLSQTADGGME